MYAYRTNEGTEVSRAKGLTINHGNNNLFQPEMLEAMVRDPPTIHKVASPYKSFRLKFERNLTSGRQEKLFRFTFDKQNVIGQYCNVPFGFCKSE